MWKLITAGVGLVAGSIVGIALGDRWARQEFGERLSVVNEIAQQSRGNAARRGAAEFLAVARLLRDGDNDRALEFIEATIERQRAEIAADQGTVRATDLDPGLLKSIEEYQTAYPWSPPRPDPEESEFAARFGRLGPTIQNGRLIGFRVLGVQPGSVFAQIGVVNGDLITDYDGQAVSMDRRPSLFEALESGSGVELMIRAADGTVRELKVPPR